MKAVKRTPADQLFSPSIETRDIRTEAHCLRAPLPCVPRFCLGPSNTPAAGTCEILHVQVGRRAVEVEVVLPDILAIVPLAVGEPEQALFQDRVPLVPQR